jgi:hypothetical protein
LIDLGHLGVGYPIKDNRLPFHQLHLVVIEMVVTHGDQVDIQGRRGIARIGAAGVGEDEKPFWTLYGEDGMAIPPEFYSFHFGRRGYGR